MNHKNVTECVVVGKRDQKNNEYLKAYIVAENLSLEEVRKYSSQYLASNTIPKVIEFVSTIKKNLVGKVDYFTL